MKESTSSKRNELLAKVGIYAIMAAPIVVLYFVYRVPLKYFLLGSGSWGFGLMIKMLLYHGVIRKLPKSVPVAISAIANGVSSGVCELGAAIAIFALVAPMTFLQVLAFGVGIGSFEAWLVATIPNLLSGTDLHSGAQKLESQIAQLPPAQRRVFEILFPILERLFASMIHVGTRALTYVCLASESMLAGLLAVAVFVFVDGWLAFRLLMSENPNLRQMRLLYLNLGLTAAISFAAGLFALSRLYPS
ncbi:MAG: hypothetical protein WAU88_03835 [Candidatus Zixiibacteriota bacterium]